MELSSDSEDARCHAKGVLPGNVNMSCLSLSCHFRQQHLVRLISGILYLISVFFS